jgi:D-alanyl-D-alanine carboxypeptidase
MASIGAMLAISSLFVYQSIEELNTTTKQIQLSTELGDKLFKALPPNLFKNVTVEGKAAYVMDITTGKVLFEKNENEQLPLASITKVMTAIVATENASPDTIITITPDAIAVDGNNGLKEGEQWRLKDLLDFTLLVSSNNGAQAIADYFGFDKFITMMNNKAEELGLTSLYYINPSGLDTANLLDTGGKGDAEDVAKLFAYVVTHHPDLLESTRSKTGTYYSESMKHDGTNTDIIVDNIPNIIASKTGYTDLAGGNLGIVFEPVPGRPVAVVVLGSSYDSRFSDVYKLASTTLETYNRR